MAPTVNPRLDIIYKKEWQLHWRDYFQKLFPEDWRKPDPDNILKLGFHMKLAGIDWRDQQELGTAMHKFHQIDWIEIEMNADKTRMRFRWKPITWV